MEKANHKIQNRVQKRNIEEILLAIKRAPSLEKRNRPRTNYGCNLQTRSKSMMIKSKRKAQYSANGV